MIDRRRAGDAQLIMVVIAAGAGGIAFVSFYNVDSAVIIAGIAVALLAAGALLFFLATSILRRIRRGERRATCPKYLPSARMQSGLRRR